MPIWGLLKWRPVGQIQPPRPFLFGPLITSQNIERHRALVFIWPSDMYRIFEQSLALYGLPEKIIENRPLPYFIDSDAVFWSYYTRFKTNKAKICIQIGLIFVFCTIIMLPFLLNLSFFVHWNIMKFCPGRQVAPWCMK